MGNGEVFGGKRGNQMIWRENGFFRKIFFSCASALLVGSVFLLAGFVNANDQAIIYKDGGQETSPSADNEVETEEDDQEDIGYAVGHQQDKQVKEEERVIEPNVDLFSQGDVAIESCTDDSLSSVEGNQTTQDQQASPAPGQLPDSLRVQDEPTEQTTDDDDDDLKGAVLISEVMVGQDGFLKNEFIELYNTTEEDLDLDGWSLKKMTKSGSISILLSSSKFSGVIKKSGYFVIVNQSYQAIGHDAMFSGSSYSIANDNSAVLFDKEGELVDALCWGQCEHHCLGSKVDQNPPNGKSVAWNESAKQYQVSTQPTPGKENYFPPKIDYPKNIKLNEIMPNPDGIDKDHEWIELMLVGNEAAALNGWWLENGSGKRFELSGEQFNEAGLLSVRIIGTSFTVRNSNEQLTLFDPNGELVDTVAFQGSAGSGLSYNRTPQEQWKWSRFLTPGAPNKFNNPPKIAIKKSKHVYLDIYAEFDASKTTDRDWDKLKFKWDFGDGHKSYLKETRHKFDKKGKYTVTLTVDDGSEKVAKTFKIEVKSFPRRELALIKLVPNPSGADRGREVIVIKNLYNKKVNLQNWSIANGSSKAKLVNHPIYQDFIIKPDQEKELVNGDICKFSLLNKKGYVLLRYPDGKIADIVRYEKEKIAEDEAYVLAQGQWEWVGGADGEAQITQVLPEVVQGATDTTNYFDFLLLTMNEQEQVCECTGRILADNWKNKFSSWLRFIKI